MRPALDSVCRDFYHESELPAYWMLPVSRYQNFNQLQQNYINVGFIDLKLRSETTPQEIQDSLQRQISEHAHWGGYWGFVLGGLLPLFILKKLVRWNAKLQPRVGVFTNMGEIKIERVLTQFWLGAPPVVLGLPLSATAVTWNSQLCLALKLHPSISDFENKADLIMRNWMERILHEATEISTRHRRGVNDGQSRAYELST